MRKKNKKKQNINERKIQFSQFFLLLSVCSTELMCKMEKREKEEITETKPEK